MMPFSAVSISEWLAGDLPFLATHENRSPVSNSPTLSDLVERTQKTMAHAWVARAFVRHSDEAEDFVELMVIGRAVFDLSIALETRLEDPAAYFKMLTKKIGKFRAAVKQFAIDAPQASTHTNFQQCVISLQTCVDDLTEAIEQAKAIQAE